MSADAFECESRGYQCSRCGKEVSPEELHPSDGFIPFENDKWTHFYCHDHHPGGMALFWTPIRRPWIQIVKLAMAELTDVQDHSYLDIFSELVPFIKDHFDYLCKGHHTNGWITRVADTLPSHPLLFEQSPGHRKSNYWRLRLSFDSSAKNMPSQDLIGPLRPPDRPRMNTSLKQKRNRACVLKELFNVEFKSRVGTHYLMPSSTMSNPSLPPRMPAVYNFESILDHCSELYTLSLSSSSSSSPPSSSPPSPSSPSSSSPSSSSSSVLTLSS